MIDLPRSSTFSEENQGYGSPEIDIRHLRIVGARYLAAGVLMVLSSSAALILDNKNLDSFNTGTIGFVDALGIGSFAVGRFRRNEAKHLENMNE